MNSVRHVAFFVSLCLGACLLAGCGRFIPHLVEPEPYAYNVPYPDAPEFKFDEFVAFGEQIAHQWDPNVKLDWFARLTPCDEIGSTTEQWTGFAYWRPYLYWLGKRVEWLEISVSPDKPLASIEIWTGAPGTWDTSPTDLAQLKIDYATALQMVSDDVLQLCIDGVTGEPCEYFVPDDPPPEDERLPADIAGHPRARYSAREQTS